MPEILRIISIGRRFHWEWFKTIHLGHVKKRKGVKDFSLRDIFMQL